MLQRNLPVKTTSRWVVMFSLYVLTIWWGKSILALEITLEVIARGWGHLSSISLIDLLRPKRLGVFYRERYILISWKYCHIHLLSSLSSEHDIEVFLKQIQQPYFAWLCQMCVFVAFIVLKVCFSWNQLALSVEQKLTLPWLRSKGAQTILSDLTEKSKSFNLVASDFQAFICL